MFRFPRVTKIEKIECNPDEVLVINVEIGHMPISRSKEYLDRVKAEIKGSGHFHPDTKMMFVAVKDGVPAVSFKVVKYNP